MFDEFVLGGSLPQFLDDETSNALCRFGPLSEWIDARYAQNLFPYSKYTSSMVGPEVTTHVRDNELFRGINFASQDYLNLSTHPDVICAAKEAIDQYGLHSAGSAALMGNTEASVALEEKNAKFTGYADCTLFPTGWGAGYGVIRTLTRPDDHVVIDVLAHACLHEGARAATSNVHVFPHLSNEGVARRLQRIREKDTKNSILVVTESTFSMDSDVPRMPELQEVCNEHGATLVVDCAHDLGVIGETGRGQLERQKFVGQPDILMGSFSKTFASNGGFVATNTKELKLGIRYTCGPNLFSNAISPVNAASVSKCFDIVDSDEGADRRLSLMKNVQLLRTLLIERDFQVLGQAGPIVPVILGGNGISRLATKYAMENGGIVNLVEYPAVSKNTCRWRLQVMSHHHESQIRMFVEIATLARDQARQHI